MPEAAELHEPDNDLQAQIKELQNNVTDVWNYIYELRSAVSHHLTHLRQHQVELETSMHRMEHLHENDLKSSMHHHSGEQHSHSGEHHSHGDDHSHGNDHSHGSMESHSHSGEHHSHSGEHHHSDEHGHHSYSHSYAHSSHDHSKEDSHSHGAHDDHTDHQDHGHDHKDSHETEDLTQTQKVVPVAEPVVTATNKEDHHHHHHHHHQSSFSSDNMNLFNEHGLHHHHHNHSHDSSSSGPNRTVVLPKYSEYGLYDLAICRVTPNTALSEDQKQNIFGTVTMWQKKTGGPLNFHVRLQGFDVGDHHAHQQQTIQTEEDNETPQPSVGHTHGFHIHSLGDLSNSCQSTGPHYNPKGVNHGKPGPDALSRHVGDLGNIQCDEHGNTNIVFSDEVASLKPVSQIIKGQYSVIGKSMVIHANEDDLGLGGDAESLRTGNAGTRVACCVIQSVDKIPIRQYKSMKTATQRNN